MPITITKRQAATTQIETAIKLFFENRDLISAYTLIAAGDGILDGIWKNESDSIQQRRFANDKPFQLTFREEWGIRIKDEYKKLGWELFNATQNFFKHADLDHDKTHLFHSIEMTAIRLRTTIQNYGLIFEEVSPAMNAYCCWHAIFYPEFLNKDSALYTLIKDNSIREEVEKVNSHEDRVLVGMRMLEQTCPELFGKSKYL